MLLDEEVDSMGASRVVPPGLVAPSASALSDALVSSCLSAIGLPSSMVLREVASMGLGSLLAVGLVCSMVMAGRSSRLGARGSSAPPPNIQSKPRS